MEKIITELKKIIKFKQTTVEGDIVLIFAENPQTMFYGLITAIERDTEKRNEWWHLTFQALSSVPPQKMTWTLREPQFTGQETFTMGGKKHFIKALDFPLSGPGPLKQTKQLKKTNRPSLRVLK
ncbi:MAG: hypothetical protein U9R66_12435 [Thermodesulfobacteriota bacterium]|nr:hypothetical protein [Thermodesulfobacteriota bacterium]